VGPMIAWGIIINQQHPLKGRADSIVRLSGASTLGCCLFPADSAGDNLGKRRETPGCGRYQPVMIDGLAGLATPFPNSDDTSAPPVMVAFIRP
jgi:hypothetical protein